MDLAIFNHFRLPVRKGREKGGNAALPISGPGIVQKKDISVNSAIQMSGEIIDAEFETIFPDGRNASAAQCLKPAPLVETQQQSDELGFLRGNDVVSEAASHPNQLTPSFLFFTALTAFVVFWVSGGHALLY
jgi:hypothetical protein